MKVLVTGGAGLLGYNVVNVLVKAGFDVYATFHARRVDVEGAKWLYLDLEDVESIGEVVRAVRPDVVIHTAAYTDVDGCEVNREKAYRVNYLATRAMAKTAEKAYVVYISTDYVFDGSRGMYREEDIPNPVNYYGFTKLLGEVAVQSRVERWAVVRVSGLYGFSPTGKKNFGVLVLEKLRAGAEVQAFYDQYLSPTYVYHLAEVLLKFVERQPVGVFHVAGERMSRYQFALAVAKALGVGEELVKPISITQASLVAKRPKDSSLDTAKARELGLFLPPVEVSIRHFTSV